MSDDHRPNILLVMADQLAARYLPTYGHGVVKAPNIAALADRGLVFTSAYSNSPLCAPARCAMMTSRRNSDIGAYDNAAELHASVPTFAHHLRAGGYQTCLAGKMHFVGPDQLHGFEERLTTDIYPADFGWTPNWDESETRVDWWFHNMDSVRNAGVADSTNQLDYDDEVAFQSVRKLRDLARSSDRRPWMLTASFTHPHDPYVMRSEFWDLYDHHSIDMPRVPALPVDTLDPHSRRLRNVSAMDEDPVSDSQIRNARHAYYSSISYIDHRVGELMGALEATGQEVNTVVLFTADHGDMLGERGLWFKMTFFDGACRIPMILAGPGVNSGVTCGENVSLADVMPTLLAAAGIAVPTEAEGTTLVDIASGHCGHDRPVFGEYLGEGAVAPIFMIRQGRYKYVHCDVDPPQLYDLENDPDELINMAGDPLQSHVVKAFDGLVRSRWDTKQVHADVLASQRARRLIDAALRQGHRTPWDHQPFLNASERFMRNHFNLNDVERGRRFPAASPGTARD